MPTPKNTPLSNTTSAIISTANSLQDLLSRYGEDFIQSAYQTVLGRAADAEGLAHYLARLYSGCGKTDILAQLATSAEGRGRATTLPGLAQLVASHQKSRPSWMGWFKRNAQSQYQIYRLEEMLGALQHQVHFQEKKLETQMSQLQARLVDMPVSTQVQPLESLHLDVVVQAQSTRLYQPDNTHLGQQARRWLGQLQRAQSLGLNTAVTTEQQ